MLLHQISDKVRRYDQLYMNIAFSVAEMSFATRLKVGSVLVKDGRILSIGFNGMPRGWPNGCEYVNDEGDLVTRIEVLHSEANCLMKVACSTESSEGATMYCTHSPCIQCSKMIHQAKIDSLVYAQKYRSDEGLNFLRNCGISVRKFEYEDK